jgi:hypothetical protein
MNDPICICNIRDGESLYWFVDPETNERCVAHAECGEDHGLDGGEETVDQ